MKKVLKTLAYVSHVQREHKPRDPDVDTYPAIVSDPAVEAGADEAVGPKLQSKICGELDERGQDATFESFKDGWNSESGEVPFTVEEAFGKSRC